MSGPNVPEQGLPSTGTEEPNGKEDSKYDDWVRISPKQCARMTKLALEPEMWIAADCT